MFFFLTLREGSSGGTIEPDVLATSSTTDPSANTSRTTALKSSVSRTTTSFHDYLTKWDMSDKPALFRRVACMVCWFLHTPINLIWILSYGFSFMLFVGIVVSFLNLACVGVALWKLDVMRGGRLLYYKIYRRHNFDYIILALFIIYGFAFGVLLFARLRINTWRWFFRIVWPILTATDIVCFISGWIATWRDVSVAPLG